MLKYLQKFVKLDKCLTNLQLLVIKWHIDKEPDKWLSVYTFIEWYKEVSTINLRK